ncbi:MAG TPA: methyltransferase [Nocardioidaceae bacterium]|nr:methyltransferase [Nocardioidaceae bacterium]
MTLRLDPASVQRLRAALAAASYTVDGVSALVGESAHRALARNETTPALRRTRDGSALATLTRLWPLQSVVSADEAERALPGLVDPLCRAGVLERSVAEVRARVDLRPYADDERGWWVMSDLTPGLDGGPSRVGSDHVLGISAASGSLAGLTIRDQVDTALDLGTGCGVQSLHLAGHSRHVVGTDVNQRALAMAAINAALNEVDVDLRDGSLFDSVRGERFDLIVTNPPFVVSPGPSGRERLVYRDSGLPGDEVVRRIVTGAGDRLNPGGWCQVLANWVHREGEPWQQRLTDWLRPTGCDAWVLQREVTDLPEYVELWLADAGLRGAPDYARRYDTWLSWFAEQGIEAVGFGWVCLHRAEREVPELRIEHWPYEVEQPLGPHVADWGRRTRWLAEQADLDTTYLTVGADVAQESTAAPGAEHPSHIVLRQQRGLRRAVQVDTVQAGLVGACDGELSVGQILDALAVLVERPAAELRRDYLPKVRELVADGILRPPDPR